MSEIDPDIIPDLWDFCLIGGHSTSGICEITQGGRVLKWEKKAGFGSAGATTKLTGIEPGEFQIKISFYDKVFGQTAKEQRDYHEQTILPLLKEAEAGKKSLDFYHPAVSEPPMSCTAVVPQKVGIYEQDSNGLWTVTISMLQYLKPKPAVGAPAGAKKKQQPAALDENEKRIQELTKQLKELT